MAQETIALIQLSKVTLAGTWVVNPCPMVSLANHDVTIEGYRAVVKGDKVQSHTDPVPTSPPVHPAATMESTQTNVTIYGVAVVLNGDMASCGHGPISGDTVNVTIAAA